MPGLPRIESLAAIGRKAAEMQRAKPVPKPEIAQRFVDTTKGMNSTETLAAWSRRGKTVNEIRVGTGSPSVDSKKIDPAGGRAKPAEGNTQHTPNESPGAHLNGKGADQKPGGSPAGESKTMRDDNREISPEDKLIQEKMSQWETFNEKPKDSAEQRAWQNRKDTAYNRARDEVYENKVQAELGEWEGKQQIPNSINNPREYAEFQQKLAAKRSELRQKYGVTEADKEPGATRNLNEFRTEPPGDSKKSEAKKTHPDQPKYDSMVNAKLDEWEKKRGKMPEEAGEERNKWIRERNEAKDGFQREVNQTWLEDSLAQYDRDHAMPDKEKDRAGYEKWMEDRGKFEQTERDRLGIKDEKGKSKNEKTKPEQKDEQRDQKNEYDETAELEAQLVRLTQEFTNLNNSISSLLPRSKEPEIAVQIDSLVKQRTEKFAEIQLVLAKLGQQPNQRGSLLSTIATLFMALGGAAQMTQAMQEPEPAR